MAAIAVSSRRKVPTESDPRREGPSVASTAADGGRDRRGLDTRVSSFSSSSSSSSFPPFVAPLSTGQTHSKRRRTGQTQTDPDRPKSKTRAGIGLHALRLRQQTQPARVGSDGMARPLLSILARHLLLTRVRHWAASSPPAPLLRELVELPVAPHIIHRVSPPLQPQATTAITSASRFCITTGFDAIARTLLIHQYGTVDRTAIAREPDAHFDAFPIRQDVKCAPADKRDSRGVTTVVRATKDITPGRIIGIYEGRVFLEGEQVDSHVTVINRFESEYKLCGFAGEEEGVHYILDEILDSVGFASVKLKKTSRPLRNEAHERLIKTSLIMDASVCQGMYAWVSEVNDYRGVAVEENCQFTEVWIAEWPVIFVIALKHISAGDEILLDYGSEYWRRIRLEERDHFIVNRLLSPLDFVMDSFVDSLESLVKLHTPSIKHLEDAALAIEHTYAPHWPHLPLPQRRILQQTLDRIALAHQALLLTLAGAVAVCYRINADRDARDAAQRHVARGSRAAADARRVGRSKAVAVYFAARMHWFSVWRAAVERLARASLRWLNMTDRPRIAIASPVAPPVVGGGRDNVHLGLPTKGMDRNHDATVIPLPKRGSVPRATAGPRPACVVTKLSVEDQRSILLNETRPSFSANASVNNASRSVAPHPAPLSTRKPAFYHTRIILDASDDEDDDVEALSNTEHAAFQGLQETVALPKFEVKDLPTQSGNR
ncbi:hypothetical protein BC830DRAFT_1170796 [Chytriomyces sp. MP71]|nr:hypothetical protein BC830DRAFT_1170796 [Chytriomyces sp. MP71]